MQDWIISAVILIALFAGFIALVMWSWSKSRQPEFNAASQLPLQDDEAEIEAIHKNEQSDEANLNQIENNRFEK